MFNEGNKVIPVDIKKEMEKSYLAYSMSVIAGRALPDVRDGLKPVHRRIIYTMYQAGLTPDKAYRKSATTVGDVLGSYHPHGDSSVYDALVRMAQKFSLRYTLVDGHGNFGSVDGDPPAAYRYTEARMSKMACEIIADIEKETVDYKPNYDDSKKEPVVLPSRFPNLLVNGSTGIAVGMATNIPPHNLNEVIDGVTMLIDNPDAGVLELMDIIKGPDFPTAGIIMGQAGIRAAYATGRGKITLRGRAEIEEWKNDRYRIVITEIPYMVNKARLVENIADLVKEKRIEGITDLRDESDRNGMSIVIELRRDANPQVVLNKLYTYTQLQDTVGVIMLALSNGIPKVMTLREMLSEYLDFQVEIITRRVTYDLRRAEERKHILDGLKIAQDNIDRVIAIIRGSKDNNESRPKLMEEFSLTEIQANAILTMQLGRLSSLDRLKIEDELESIKAKIAEYMAILADDDRIRGIVRDELSEIKRKFGDARRTEIQAVSGEVDIEDLIEREDCIVTLTHFGYIKRQTVDSYRTQSRGGVGVTAMTTREDDFASELFVANTHDYILFFTSKGRVLRLKCYEIPAAARTAKGSNIINLLPLETDERIKSVIKVSQFDDEHNLMFVTKKGIIKRTVLSLYNTARKGGIIALTVDPGDELCAVRKTNGRNELIVATKKGMAIKFKEDDVRLMGRLARGVKALNLKADDEVIGLCRVRADATLLTVTEKGLGRRSDPSEYRLISRGGKGVTNYKVNEKSGDVAGIIMVDSGDGIIMITDAGIIIKIEADSISRQSRTAKGVRVMRVAEGSIIATVARTPKEDDNADVDGDVSNEAEVSTEETTVVETLEETEVLAEINEENEDEEN